MTIAGNSTPRVDRSVASILAEVFTAWMSPKPTVVNSLARLSVQAVGTTSASACLFKRVIQARTGTELLRAAATGAIRRQAFDLACRRRRTPTGRGGTMTAMARSAQAAPAAAGRLELLDGITVRTQKTRTIEVNQVGRSICDPYLGLPGDFPKITTHERPAREGRDIDQTGG